MSLSKYLKSIAKEGAVSENALYAALKSHLICGLLNYPSSNVLITPALKKTGKKKNIGEKFGIPDLQLKSADETLWIVGEAKLSDEDIRNDKKRDALWQEKMIERRYIGAETFYVLLCAPKTFYLYDIYYKLQAGLHIEGESLLDLLSGQSVEATDREFQRLLRLASFEESKAQPQFQRFRAGLLPSGYIPITKETLPQLEEAFTRSLSELKAYCKAHFESLKSGYDAVYAPALAELDKKIADAGGDRRRRRMLNLQRYRLRDKFAVHRKLFEEDYPHFRDAQAYSGTEKEEDFQDVFITNTCHVALSRLIFVRIAEDMGMTKKRISNAAMAVWVTFSDNLRDSYQDIIELTFRQVEPLYTKLFETTAFDWYGKGNGELSRVLERVLFRLNAFDFSAVSRDILGTMYQSFRPRIERKRLGEYYTEDTVVDFILRETGIAEDDAILSKKILDPACGSFTFGVRAAQAILERARQLSPENKLQAIRETLYGADINAFSVFISHLSLFFTTLDLYRDAKAKNAKFELQGFNLVAQNSLFSAASVSDDELSERDASFPMRFDYIVGNPPFVRNERLPENDRFGLQELYKTIWRKNPDLSVFFVYEMLRNALKDGGTLGFVLPIGIANADYATPIREFLFKSENPDQTDKYTITTLVSLEWMAKEVFKDADIIPILLFIKKERPQKDHRIKIISGLKSLNDLQRAMTDRDYLNQHTAFIPQADFKMLSPNADWCLEVTERDLPVLKKLRARPTLSKISKTSFAIKVGSGSGAIQAIGSADGKRKRPKNVIPFAKGQHVLAFGIDDADELLDLNKTNLLDDASIWEEKRLLGFKNPQMRQSDETELIEYAVKPSDEFACVIPRVTVTLNAAVFSPFDLSFNDSCLIVIPTKYTAHALCAIINSLPSRYFAFLTSRTAILLRRRTTWVARTIDNLPLPSLTDETAAELHRLSLEAHSISKSASQTPEEAFAAEVAKGRNQKAGLLGIQWESDADTFDAEELATARLEGESLILDSVTFTAPTRALCELLLIALRAEASDEIRIDDVQDLLLPKENHDALAASLRAIAENLRTAEARMKAVTDAIDELVAEGLGVSIDAIRQRCAEFPLSETVMKPRYAWSSDRKRQARRSYEKGKRFK